MFCLKEAPAETATIVQDLHERGDLDLEVVEEDDDPGTGDEDGEVQCILVSLDDLQLHHWGSMATGQIASGQTDQTEFEMEAEEDAFDCTDDKTENVTGCKIDRNILAAEADNDGYDNFADMIVKKRTKILERQVLSYLTLANF